MLIYTKALDCFRLFYKRSDLTFAERMSPPVGGGEFQLFIIVPVLTEVFQVDQLIFNIL